LKVVRNVLEECAVSMNLKWLNTISLLRQPAMQKLIHYLKFQRLFVSSSSVHQPLKWWDRTTLSHCRLPEKNSVQTAPSHLHLKAMYVFLQYIGTHLWILQGVIPHKTATQTHWMNFRNDKKENGLQFVKNFTWQFKFLISH
jgi:hypothetical protein